jgi:uncharacterized membrane protein YhaH (DUF805 family)
MKLVLAMAILAVLLVIIIPIAVYAKKVVDANRKVRFFLRPQAGRQAWWDAWVVLCCVVLCCAVCVHKQTNKQTNMTGMTPASALAPTNPL